MNKTEETLKTMDFEFFGRGEYKVSAEEFLSYKDATLLDIRTDEEINTISLNLKHHMNVLHIPLHELPEKTDKITSDTVTGLFCASGVRTAMAYLFLKSKGFTNIKMVTGGFEEIVKELKPGKIFKFTEQ